MPRPFPAVVDVVVQRGTCPELPIFALIRHLGQVDDGKMFHVFNVGPGMVVVVPPNTPTLALETLPGDCYLVGEVVPATAKFTSAAGITHSSASFPLLSTGPVEFRSNSGQG